MQYAKRHEAALAKHTLAIESDSGVFKPTGFGFLGSGRGMEIIQGVGKLLDPISAGRIDKGCRGADVLKLVRGGVPVMHLEVDREKYFWYHHTDADTMDKLDVGEFNQCVAAMAVMAYVIADLPETLPPDFPKLTPFCGLRFEYTGVQNRSFWATFRRRDGFETVQNHIFIHGRMPWRSAWPSGGIPAKRCANQSGRV